MTVASLRICRDCSTPLSRYNPETRCMRCDRARRDRAMGLIDDTPREPEPPRPPVNPRPRGASALPRVGFRREIAYLEELRERLALRDGESEDTVALDRVIALMQAEATRR